MKYDNLKEMYFARRRHIERYGFDKAFEIEGDPVEIDEDNSYKKSNKKYKEVKSK